MKGAGLYQPLYLASPLPGLFSLHNGPRAGYTSQRKKQLRKGFAQKHGRLSLFKVYALSFLLNCLL